MIDWSEIQVKARRDGLSQREIARRLVIPRVDVRQAMPVVALLLDHLLIPVTVIAERFN